MDREVERKKIISQIELNAWYTERDAQMRLLAKKYDVILFLIIGGEIYE